VDGSVRRTRFEARVSLERNFLSRLNEKFGNSVPLAGMTRDAIDSWERRATVRFPASDIRGIAQILIEASTHAELLADNSKDVFEIVRRPKPDSLRELHELLDIALAEPHIGH
jgi:hypothetical protein